MPDGRSVASLDRGALADALGHPVATLDEVVARWPDRIWNIELKDAAAADATVEVLSEATLAGVLVTSFLHDVAHRVGDAAGVPFGYLVGHRPLDFVGLARRSVEEGARAVVLHGEHLDPRVVSTAGEAGLAIWVYGLLTPPEFAWAVELGVVAIIADDVAAALAAARSNENGRAPG